MAVPAGWLFCYLIRRVGTPQPRLAAFLGVRVLPCRSGLFVLFIYFGSRFGFSLSLCWREERARLGGKEANQKPRPPLRADPARILHASSLFSSFFVSPPLLFFPLFPPFSSLPP